MAVDIQAILEASKPKPIVHEQMVSLLRLAKADRSYKRAQELREKQEYNALTISQGNQIASSVSPVDSINDIDTAIADLNNLAKANQDNKVVQAAAVTQGGVLEKTREMAIGRQDSSERLSILQDEILNLTESRSKGALYNESTVIDLINNTRNFVNNKSVYMDDDMKSDFRSAIEDLNKTVNIYNMLEFYDTNLETPELDFEQNPDSAKFLSAMQREVLQQAKNYADAGFIDESGATLAKLPAVGIAESKARSLSTERQVRNLQIEEFGSSIASINQLTDLTQAMLGKGVDEEDELKFPTGMKEKLGGLTLKLPTSPQRLALEGGLNSVNNSIRQTSEMIGIILGEATDVALSAERLDKIKIDPSEASYLKMSEGSNLKEILESYNLAETDEEKEPYMKILARYMSNPKYANQIKYAFRSGDVTGVSEEEKNAVKLLSNVSRTYNQLVDLRDSHFGQFHIGKAYQSFFNDPGTQTHINW